MNFVSYIQPSLNFMILGRNLFKNSCLCFFSGYCKKTCRTVLPMYLRLMCHPSMHTDKCCPTAGGLLSQSSPQKSAGSKLQLCSKWSLKWPSPENFLANSGCFECNTYPVMVISWLKKERKKKKRNNSDFWPFQVGFHSFCYCRLGEPIHV